MSDLEQAAADFLRRREEPGWCERDEAQLASWLERSDRHKAIFWRLEHGWRAADRVASLGLEPAAVNRNGRSIAASLARRAGFALAASVLPVAIGLSLMLHTQSTTEYQLFETPMGGRKLLMLTDGTRVDLNSDSRVRVAMNDRDRNVILDKGEAYFEVTHDPHRPFHVALGDRQVEVVGTKFVVRRQGSRTITAVREGVVRVGRMVEGSVRDQLVLKRGDSAVSSGQTTIAHYDDINAVDGMLGWQHGMITFNRVPLAEAAAEFNRYNDVRLIVDGKDAPSMRIGGSFRLNNVEGFARLMRDAYGLEVQTGNGTITISR